MGHRDAFFTVSEAETHSFVPPDRRPEMRIVNDEAKSGDKGEVSNRKISKGKH